MRMKSTPAFALGGFLAFVVACSDGGTTPASSSPAPTMTGGSSSAPPDSAGAFGAGLGAAVATGGAAPTGGGSSPSGGGSPSSGGNTGGSSGGNSPSGGTTAELSFKADIWPVFEKIRNPVFVYRGAGSYESCTTSGVCHGGTNPGARLSMANSETAYRQLVDVPSTTSLCNGTIRVVPGDPEKSCLILFYEGRLRDDLEWVQTVEIDLVRRWIAQGARP